MHSTTNIFSKQWFGRFVLASVVLVLTACGGGGGSGAPANRAPTANAGPDQSVARNSQVTLTGTGTDDGGSLTYAWSQTSGPSVTLAGGTTRTATFTAPDVSADTALGFSFRVTDSAGLSATDTVVITVFGNVAPTVNAGSDQVAEQNSAVTMSGSATDDVPGTLTYAWTQVGGPNVSLSGADTQTASFTAPLTTTTISLEFELAVTDSEGAVGTDPITVLVVNDITRVTLSGKIEFENIPVNSSGRGLNYSAAAPSPVRGATVQLLRVSDSSVLDSVVSAADGRYSFELDANTQVFLRVRAELKGAGGQWDTEVRDNTSNTALVLSQRPLYVLDGPAFNSGVGLTSRDLLADSGWGGSSYTTTRAAAPFKILDVAYQSMQLVLDHDAAAVFAPLDIFWSVNNRPAVNSQGNRDYDTGEIGTSFYVSSLNSMFLLGAENVDTEEFDTHVIAHEWAHYFEDNFSRSDSIGGAHSSGQRLDPRLAFGEGFGNAFSAMAMGGPVYFDTSGSTQSTGFSFNLESSPSATSAKGWFNERSIQLVLYDLFDEAADAGDTLALGFGPMYDVLVNEQRTGVAFTTIYPFVAGLKARDASISADVDAMLAVELITGTSNDDYGSAEINNAGGGSSDVLPIYTEVVVGASPVNICSTKFFDGGNDGNKLSIRRFVRFSLSAAGNYRILLTATNSPMGGQTDPDAVVFQVVPVAIGTSVVADVEDFNFNGATPGDYVMELYEYSYLNDTIAPLSQTSTCFDVSINPA